MPASFITTGLRRIYTQRLNRQIQEVPHADFPRSAIVFAPHPDDETLGCGGTILKKKRAGADIHIVVMTDGRTSHSHLIPAEELIAIRAAEAVAAGQMLGVPAAQVTLLGFEDGRLGHQQAAAIPQVTALLERIQPDEVFIPYVNEPPADHVATNWIVLAALVALDKPTLVYEYPIWFWHHWPWMQLPLGIRRETRTIVKNSVKARLGTRLLQDFRHAVHIGDVIAEKRAALDQHKSQMTRLRPIPNWLTLSDVANGEFLACFFQERELFRRYSFKGSA